MTTVLSVASLNEYPAMFHGLPEAWLTALTESGFCPTSEYPFTTIRINRVEAMTPSQAADRIHHPSPETGRDLPHLYCEAMRSRLGKTDVLSDIDLEHGFYRCMIEIVPATK